MSTIETMIQNIIDDDYNAAGDAFNGLIGDKVTDALDQQKASIAGSIYGGATVETEVEPELDDETTLETEEEVEDEDV